jgi:hypothetical protein
MWQENSSLVKTGQMKQALHMNTYTHLGARGGTVSWGTVLQPGISRVQFLMVLMEFFC